MILLYIIILCLTCLHRRGFSFLFLVVFKLIVVPPCNNIYIYILIDLIGKIYDAMHYAASSGSRDRMVL